MKFCIAIPSRLDSSRLPNKPLANINGKPLIIRVIENCEKILNKRHIYVFTPDNGIIEILDKYSYQYIKTKKNFKTGTDRIAHYANKLNYPIIINVQGDEPCINPKDILRVVDFKSKNQNFIINCYTQIKKNEDPKNINLPKVLINNKNELIYMSRLPIPGVKKINSNTKPKYFKQVCIYGFNKKDLNTFKSIKKKPFFEFYEDIEILRFLSLNKKVLMVETKKNSIGVDDQKSLNLVRKIFNK